MLYFWLFIIGLIHKFPFLINTEIPASFLIGPCLYLYFTSLMGRVEIPAESVILHGQPFIISLVMVSVINVVDESIGSQSKNPATVIPDYTQNTVILVINSLCDLSIAIYFLSAAIKTTSILLNQKMTKETKSVMFFLISFSLYAILLIMATLIRNPVLLQVSIILLSILPVDLYFFLVSQPGLCNQSYPENKTFKNRQG